MKRRRSSTPAYSEPLEARVLLSNVTAKLTNGGDLVVNGDNSRNIFSIREYGNQIRIDGQSNTTVNGSSQPFFVDVSVVPDDLRVSLKGGYNTVFINADVADDVVIKGGRGVDEIRVAVVAQGHVSVKTSNGSDLVNLAALAGSVSVNTGNGADIVAVPVAETTGDLTISTGKGDDAVTLWYPNSVGYGVRVGDDLTLQTGSGDDNILMRAEIQDRMKLNMGSGEDILAIEDTVLGTVTDVDGGSGDNAIVLNNLSAAPDAEVNFDRFQTGTQADIPDSLFEARFDQANDPFSIFTIPLP